eukprot:11049259-Alexandrium_andersonii.AAC.1
MCIRDRLLLEALRAHHHFGGLHHRPVAAGALEVVAPCLLRSVGAAPHEPPPAARRSRDDLGALPAAV